MGLKLKRLKKHEVYPPVGGRCAVARCRAMSTIGYAAGAAFLAEKGDVALCDEHNAKLELADDSKDTEEATALIPPPAFRAALQTEETDAKEALALIREFEILVQEDYDFANEALGDAKTSWKGLEERKKKATGPLNAALREIRSWFKPPQDFYAEAERLLKGKLAEAHRKAAEAQDAALRAVQEAHAAGDAPAVREALVQAEASEIQQADNVTVLEVWDFEVVNSAAVPREFLMPDLQKIQGVVRTMKADTNIPGVRVFFRDSVTRRGA